MKVLFATFACLLFTSFAYGQTTVCSNDNYEVALTIDANKVSKVKISGGMNYTDTEPQVTWVQSGTINHYEFLVDESYDTKVIFAIALENGKVVKRQLIEAGNDSDNYWGQVVSEGDQAFICQ